MTAPAATTIRHVTLNTGHVHRSTVAEVDAAVFRTVGPLLVHTDGRQQRLPEPFQRWRFSATAQDDALMGTLWAQHNGSGVPVLTFAVAGDAHSAALAWPVVTAHAEQFSIRVHATRAASPWLATVLLPTLGVLPETLAREGMTWAADFQRCVAWSWLQKRGMVEPAHPP